MTKNHMSSTTVDMLRMIPLVLPIPDTRYHDTQGRRYRYSMPILAEIWFWWSSIHNSPVTLV